MRVHVRVCAHVCAHACVFKGRGDGIPMDRQALTPKSEVWFLLVTKLREQL